MQDAGVIEKGGGVGFGCCSPTPLGYQNILNCVHLSEKLSSLAGLAAARGDRIYGGR